MHNEMAKASRQIHSGWQLYNNGKNGLQQIQMENYQLITRLKDKKKKKKSHITCVLMSLQFVLKHSSF
jgi:hypothetical protein